MTRLSCLSLLVLLAAGCHFEDAAAQPELSPLRPDLSPLRGDALYELATTDVRGAHEATTAMLERIREAPVGPEAAHRLALTCPYNRASFQLPIALKIAVDRFDVEALDPLVMQDWYTLKRGLTLHVALLDAVGAELRPPRPGDFLHAWLFFNGAFLTRAELEASADPVAASLPLIKAIPLITEQYDESTRARIEADTVTLQAATGSDRLFLPLIAGWQSALRRIEPFVHQEAEARAVRQMIEALDLLLQQTC